MRSGSWSYRPNEELGRRMFRIETLNAYDELLD